MLIPQIPSTEHIRSMALRYRHDFGMDKMQGEYAEFCGMTEQERNELCVDMLALYRKFYKLGSVVGDNAEVPARLTEVQYASFTEFDRISIRQLYEEATLQGFFRYT